MVVFGSRRGGMCGCVAVSYEVDCLVVCCLISGIIGYFASHIDNVIVWKRRFYE